MLGALSFLQWHCWVSQEVRPAIEAQLHQWLSKALIQKVLLTGQGARPG